MIMVEHYACVCCLGHRYFYFGEPYAPLWSCTCEWATPNKNKRIVATVIPPNALTDTPEFDKLGNNKSKQENSNDSVSNRV